MSACTNRVFRSASLSDVVWQAKLPKDYTEVLMKAKDGARGFDSKKQIFDYLCSKVPLHGHEVEFLPGPKYIWKVVFTFVIILLDIFIVMVESIGFKDLLYSVIKPLHFSFVVLMAESVKMIFDVNNLYQYKL